VGLKILVYDYTPHEVIWKVMKKPYKDLEGVWPIIFWVGDWIYSPPIQAKREIAECQQSDTSGLVHSHIISWGIMVPATWTYDIVILYPHDSCHHF